MFSDGGTLLVQLAITAVIIVALLAVALWLVRRYSLGGIRHGRSKVPRLTVVDAMPVDGRRRLVLVRRDNVEHLILIGGPSDVVVEQSIVRQRRPRTAEDDAAVQIAADQPVAVPAAPDNPPIPFPTPQRPAVASPSPTPVAATPAEPAVPSMANGTTNTTPAPERNFTFRRFASASGASQAPSTPAAPPPPAAVPQRGPIAEAASSAARYIDLHRPTRIEPPQPALQEPAFPDLPAAEEAPEDILSAPLNGSGPHEPPAPRDSSPFAKPATGGEEASAKVSDLEREMARLLGEITQKRPS